MRGWWSPTGCNTNFNDLYKRHKIEGNLHCVVGENAIIKTSKHSQSQREWYSMNYGTWQHYSAYTQAIPSERSAVKLLACGLALFLLSDNVYPFLGWSGECTQGSHHNQASEIGIHHLDTVEIHSNPSKPIRMLPNCMSSILVRSNLYRLH
jgi:hypothetical protein